MWVWLASAVIQADNSWIFPLRVQVVMVTLRTMQVCLVSIARHAIRLTIGPRNIAVAILGLPMKVEAESTMGARHVVTVTQKLCIARPVSRVTTAIILMMMAAMAEEMISLA